MDETKPSYAELAATVEQLREQLSAMRRQPPEGSHAPLLEEIPDPVWSVDESGGSLYLSPKVEALTGYRPAEFCADTSLWAARMHPDDADRVGRFFERLFGEGALFDAEYRFRRKDGAWIWLRDRSIAIRVEDGVRRAYGVLTDISRIREAEAARADRALRQERERVRHYLEVAGVMLIALDTGGRVTLINPKGCEILGAPEEEVLGADWFETFIPSEIVDEVRAVFARIMAGDLKPVEYYENAVRRRDGTERIIAWHNSLAYGQGGEICGLFSSGEDITERKRTERELRDALEINRSIVERSTIGIAAYDAAGQCFAANESIARLVGASREQVQRQNYHEIASWRRSGLYDAAVRAVRDQKPQRLQLSLTTSFGQKAAFETHLVPLRHGGVLVLANDIAERLRHEQEKRTLEQQLLQSQKMEAIGQLAGGMAHDFNNMLTVILANANLALTTLDEAAPQHEELNEIAQAAQRARDLTLKLLTFARRERLSVKDIRAGALLDALTKILERTLDKGICLRRTGDSEATVRGDENQLLQALVNICNNAADAMPAGGTLSIGCEQRREQGTCGTCGERFDGRFCVLRISDTGVGMPDKVRKRAIEPFYTTKGAGHGTGLGLSVTHGIIRGHGGHLDIRSEPGEGTTVRLMLPGVQAAPPDPSNSALAPSYRGSETILVVDDEPAVLRVTGRVLARMGYDPILTRSGSQALELFRRRHAEIALVVLDMLMPEMSGAEVYRQLRAIDPEVKVVLSSGYSEDGQATELLQAGVNAFVQKPFSLRALGRAIRDVLDE